MSNIEVNKHSRYITINVFEALSTLHNIYNSKAAANVFVDLQCWYHCKVLIE